MNTRRDFMVRAAVGACVPGVLQAKPVKQPNVLLIYTDQQFAGAMSCAGNP